MRKATFFYLLRRGLLTGAGGFIRDGLVMASKFITQGLTHPAQGSAEFDGSSDYIQLNTPFSYTNHTIAAWVYVDETPASTKIFLDNRDANNDGIIFLINTTENIRYSVNATDLSTDTLPINEWVYVVGTYDGTTAKIYLDGSLNDSTAVSTTVDVTTNFLIGVGTGFSSNFNGNLANVAIWNRALSSDEINAVMWKGYQSLTDNEKSGLQAWYSLDDVASPAASLATMEQLATDKDLSIENKAAITAAINALS